MIFFTEDASSSDEELKQINRELSSKKFTSQLNSVTSGRNTGGGNRHLLGTLIFLVLWQKSQHFPFFFTVDVWEKNVSVHLEHRNVRFN